MLKDVQAGSLSWCKNQSPLCHFSGLFIEGSQATVSTHSNKTADLLLVLEEPSPCALSHHLRERERERNQHCLDTWANLPHFFLVWANLVTSTDVTAALTQGRGRSTNSHHLLQLLWETEGHFWAPPANPLWADVARILQEPILQEPISSSHLPLKCIAINLRHICYFRNFVNGPTTICKNSLANILNIFITSAHGTMATMQLVFNKHFSSLETIKPLIHSCFIHGFTLKSFLEYCDSFSCSFSQKETKFHRHSFLNICHFNILKTHQTPKKKNDTKCTACHSAD